QRIAGASGAHDVLRGRGRQLVQRAVGSSRALLTRGPGNAGPAGECLDAATVAAGAERPVALHDDVADLPGTPVRAGIELAADQQPSANPSRHRDVDELAGAATGTAAMFAEGRQVRVVMEVAANPGRPREDAVERDVAESGQVGGTDDEPGGRVDRPGKADAKRPHPSRRRPVLAERVRDRGHDARDDVLPAAGSFRRSAHDGAQATAVVSDRDAQLRTAEIDPDQSHWYRGSE